MLRHLKLKMGIKTKAVNQCLSVYIMRSFWINVKLFKLRLKILKPMKLNSLMVYDDRHIKPKKGTWDNKVTNTNF